MPAVGVTIDDQATPTLQRVKGGMLDAVRKGGMKAAEGVRGEIVREVMSTFPRGRGGLARSFQPSMLQLTSGKSTFGVFSDLSYAAIQDRGGTIRPRTRQNLAIPLRAKERNSFVWPRNHPERLFRLRSRKGNLLLAVKKGSGIEPVYLLKPQVTIRPKNYLERARNRSVPVVQKHLGDSVKLNVREAGRGR